MAEPGKERLAYIDWMRGLACLLMFQTHCYDSWLGGAAREGAFRHWSQLVGTLPAPIFLFLAGVSCALMTDRTRRKGVPPNDIAKTIFRRGAEIFGLGLLFRVQEFALGQPWAPWTDLLRVDVLNIIGLSIIFIGIFCHVAQTRTASILVAAGVALTIALATPPLWTTWRPRWLPWYLESYVNGVHIYDSPRPWLFPIFPWTALAFAGLAVGFILFSDAAQKRVGRTLLLFCVVGAGLVVAALKLNASSLQIYAVPDFWHTSPNFFFARVGILLMLLGASYVWCRWGLGQTGFSPLIELGKASLLVYWVHIEFVYGRVSILAKQAQTIGWASFGLLVIFVAMVLLAMTRTRWKHSGEEILAWFRRVLSPAAEG